MANLNYNKVILCGRLCANPELKTTGSGKSVLTFSIAVSRGKDKDGKELGVDFLSATAWGSNAEFIARYFRKGSSLFVEGKLQVHKWQTQNGEARYTTETIVDTVKFVDSKAEGGNPNAVDNAVSTAIAGDAPTEQFEPVSKEDLPF